jgi:hypothetical protein
MNLEASSESLVRQTEGGEITPSDRRLEFFGKVVFGGFGFAGIAIIGGLIYTLITKFVLSGSAVAFGIAMSFFLVFAMLALVYVILKEGRKEKYSKRRVPDLGPELDIADTAKLIESGHFEPVPSVVENTTDLLKVKAKTRKM